MQPYEQARKPVITRNALVLCRFGYYLYQAVQAEHISKLPDKAKEAWFKEMENEFNKSNKEENFVSFIPFPIENISTDDSPNRWDQATLLENTTDFFTKNFS